MDDPDDKEVVPGHAIIPGMYNRYVTYIDVFCPACGSNKGTVRVAGHEQCVTCHTVIESCCD